MNSIFKISVIIVFLLLAPRLYASDPPPPPPPNGGNPSGNPVGGGAPVDGGLASLSVLAFLYAFKKYYIRHPVNKQSRYEGE